MTSEKWAENGGLKVNTTLDEKSSRLINLAVTSFVFTATVVCDCGFEIRLLRINYQILDS